MKNAQQYLHLVGGSSSECDTIPGRQSMVGVAGALANRACHFISAFYILVGISIFPLRTI